MKYNDITFKENAKKFFNEINYNCLMIYSETSMEKNNVVILNKNIKLLSTKLITKDKKKIDSKLNEFKNYEKIITFGGGTATDIGKYIAYKLKKKLICIPTMLSTNAFSTNKVALKVKNKIESLDAILPSKILLDDNILQLSAKNNLYGIADIFSIYTALNDWSLAIEYNNEIKTDEYDLANNLLSFTLDYINKESNEKIKNNIEILYNLIGESGHITNQYGSGKPESGSEHIFAKALEKEIKIPHAIAVANGILIMGISQSLYINKTFNMEIFNALYKLGIYELNKEYNITYDLIDSVFKNLKSRIDRFSIVNLICNDEEKKNKVIKEYKRILNNK